MTSRDRKRVPLLLGPRWREVSSAPQYVPGEYAFYNLLRDDAEKQVVQVAEVAQVAQQIPETQSSPASQFAPCEESFYTSLRACAEKQVEQQEPQVETSLSIQPQASEPKQSRANVVARASTWLRANVKVSLNKQLGVAEPAAIENSLPALPKTSRLSQPGSGVVANICSWLQTKSSPKRLRVGELVSLGDKRFVAVLNVEGREFLIGGGAAGVSLMTQLESTRESADAFRAVLAAKGASE